MIYLNLISGPRNISTALMYSFAQRPDTIVLDEPYYAVYLHKTGLDHPGRKTVLETQSTKEKLVHEQIYRSHDKPVVFIKNMAHHIEVLEDNCLSKTTNIFLIRNPLQIITSYSEVISDPVMRDIGIQYQHELFIQLQKKGHTPIVIDSGLILENPSVVLSKLCTECGIDFTEKMLSWPEGPKVYDGAWAPYWYDNVHRSTGFERQPTRKRELPESLQPLYEEAKVYYHELVSHAIKPY